MWRVIAATAIMATTFACTSELEIYKEGESDQIQGVPFRITETWVAEGLLITHTKQGRACEPTPFQEYQSLATGTSYYAHPDPGWLAGSEFSIMFHENGSVKQVQLNSESSFSESTKAVSELAGTVLPFITAPKEVTTETPAGAPLPACNTGKNVLSFVRLDEWTPNTWAPPR